MVNATKIPLKNIILDYQNPRLIEFRISKKTKEREILDILWKEMDVKELILSITANGFWEFEPLILLKESNKYIAVEGNRRLAAVKIIHGANSSIKLPVYLSNRVTKELLSSTKSLPAIIINSREEVWKYIGFKHVNGPQKWGSFAKAKYIAQIHRGYKVAIKDIAYQIGDTNRIAQKLYQGYMVLEQAKKAKVYNYEEDIQASRVYFSHLYTGLQREGIRAYLNISDSDKEADSPVPASNYKKLGQLLEWLFGSKKNETQALIKSQNPDLKYLDEVLQNKESTAALSAGSSLEHSYELSRPSDTVFEESVLAAKRSLQKARAQLSTGYDGEENLLKIAGTVAKLADDLYDEMEKVYHEAMLKTKKKKTRLTE